MKHPYAVAILLALMLGPAAADVADRSLIESTQVAGFTLQTPAREAFETLKSRGFDTGDLATYEDWWQSGLFAVKGDRRAPEGHVEIVLSRNGDQLVEIREHWIRLASPFDVSGEVEAKHNYFGLNADAKDCKTGANLVSASCGVEDADKTVIYLLNFNGNRQRYSVVQRLDLQPAEIARPASR